MFKTDIYLKKKVKLPCKDHRDVLFAFTVTSSPNNSKINVCM